MFFDLLNNIPPETWASMLLLIDKKFPLNSIFSEYYFIYLVRLQLRAFTI